MLVFFVIRVGTSFLQKRKRALRINPLEDFDSFGDLTGSIRRDEQTYNIYIYVYILLIL
jgi:hypothetical protein